jgi:hypothetical protein
MFRFVVLAGILTSSLAFGQVFWFTPSATPSRFAVVPFDFDPGDSDMAPVGWVQGTGCVTKRVIAIYPATSPNGTFMEPGCPTGDLPDFENEGLILMKTGPTRSNSSSGVDIIGVTGLVLTELGYDFRRGLHCGAGSPRFNIQTMDGKSYFLGCSSPAPVATPTPPYPGSAASGWTRLRWGGVGGLKAFNAATNVLETVTSPVRKLQIVFDEGQDTGPDFTGMAILDNIDVNTIMVGQGPRGFIF